jgi:hypothetical protein
VKTKKIKNNGSILVTVLFMISILALLVAAVSNDSMQNMRTISQSGRDTQAKYAAYAGLEFALNRLRNDPMYHGEEDIAERHGRMTDALDGLDGFQYDVLLWNNSKDPEETGGADPEDLEGPDGLVVRSGTVYMVSSGRHIDRGEEVMLLTMAGTARRVRPVFEDAAYARTKLALSGADARVDAWDSTAGDYVAATTGDDDDDDRGSPGNVQNYKATLGTDSAQGRTLRLLNGAELNGHYRIGPGVKEEFAYGRDGGMSVGDSTRYAVATAALDEQIAGVEPTGSPPPAETKKFVLDTKDTEVPKFVAPYDEDDVAPPPTIDTTKVPRVDEDGDPVLNMQGNQIMDPPLATSLAPGGYESVTVDKGATLELTAGVYFFRDDFNINDGKVTTVGDGPSIIFCGKKATLVDAKLNPDRATSNLQLCFTDDLQDEEVLDDLVREIGDIFGGADLPENPKDEISPPIPNSPDRERRGFSLLEVSGNTKIHGSISGRNLVANMQGGEIFGSIMGNIVKGEGSKIHQDLALKGSNLMNAGGWKLEGVHQVR